MAREIYQRLVGRLRRDQRPAVHSLVALRADMQRGRRRSARVGRRDVRGQREPGVARCAVWGVGGEAGLQRFRDRGRLWCGDGVQLRGRVVRGDAGGRAVLWDVGAVGGGVADGRAQGDVGVAGVGRGVGMAGELHQRLGRLVQRSQRPALHRGLAVRADVHRGQHRAVRGRRQGGRVQREPGVDPCSGGRLDGDGGHEWLRLGARQRCRHLLLLFGYLVHLDAGAWAVLGRVCGAATGVRDGRAQGDVGVGIDGDAGGMAGQLLELVAGLLEGE